MIEFGVRKSKGTLAYLREKYPNEKWVASRAGFGWRYENNQGDSAWWCAALAPRYDGDDDNFVRQFHIYRKTKIVERLV